MLTTLAAAPAFIGHWGGPFAAGFGWLFFLIPLFWIAVVVLIVSLVGRRRRAFWRAGGPGAAWGGPGYHGAPWAQNNAKAAEATLAERFAQGDIDEVEYRARLEVLRANRPDAS